MRFLAVVLILAGAFLPVPASEGQEPLRIDQREEVDVRLILLDALVHDGSGKPVEDLTADDFQLVVEGKPVEVDTLDVDRSRKFVFAMDYSHLDQLQRGQVIDQIKTAVQDDAGGEYMVAALTGELRIEQPFTTDRSAVLASLDRMQADPELWKPSFYHQNERGFVESVTGLFEMLGQESGTKAVMFFSAIQDVPLEEQFERIAGSAAASRSMIYGVDVRGLGVDLQDDDPRALDLEARTDVGSESATDTATSISRTAARNTAGAARPG